MVSCTFMTRWGRMCLCLRDQVRSRSHTCILRAHICACIYICIYTHMCVCVDRVVYIYRDFHATHFFARLHSPVSLSQCEHPHSRSCLICLHLCMLFVHTTTLTLTLIYIIRKRINKRARTRTHTTHIHTYIHTYIHILTNVSTSSPLSTHNARAVRVYPKPELPSTVWCVVPKRHSSFPRNKVVEEG